MTPNKFKVNAASYYTKVVLRAIFTISFSFLVGVLFLLYFSFLIHLLAGWLSPTLMVTSRFKLFLHPAQLMLSSFLVFVLFLKFFFLVVVPLLLSICPLTTYFASLIFTGCREITHANGDLTIFSSSPSSTVNTIFLVLFSHFEFTYTS